LASKVLALFLLTIFFLIFYLNPNNNDQRVYIVLAVRTPLGVLVGKFRPLTAIELGSNRHQRALSKAGVEFEEGAKVFMGNVISLTLTSSSKTRLP